LSRRWGNSVSEVTRLWVDGVNNQGEISGRGNNGTYSPSGPVLRPTQPPVQWVPGALTPGIKQLGHEADCSPPSSAKVKNACSYTSTPQYIFMVWCSIK